MGLGHKPRLYVSVVDGGKHDLRFYVYPTLEFVICRCSQSAVKRSCTMWSSVLMQLTLPLFVYELAISLYGRTMTLKFPTLPSTCSVLTTRRRTCPRPTKLLIFALLEAIPVWDEIVWSHLEEDFNNYEDELLKDKDVWFGIEVDG